MPHKSNIYNGYKVEFHFLTLILSDLDLYFQMTLTFKQVLVKNKHTELGEIWHLIIWPNNPDTQT